MQKWISGSEKNRHGEVTVYFADGMHRKSYYAHNIASVGDSSDSESKMTTAWAWVNHLRHKVWWSPTLEDEFLGECEKYL